MASGIQAGVTEHATQLSPRLEGCLPTPSQRLLLDAALATGDEALEAWQNWERKFGLDTPDEGSYRLLPQVYRNLESQGATFANANKLRGIYRQNWSKNLMLFHRSRRFIEQVTAKGIPALLLKGAPLALSAYPDLGCRPMQDIDVLVPASQAPALIRKMEESGWLPLSWRPHGFPGRFLRFRHGMDFRGPENENIDLHWHALNLCCHPSADAIFWRHAQPMDFLGLQVQTCHATEHLLEVCTHGIVWSPVPPVRWVADAVLVLRKFQVDWERLLDAALTLHIVPYLRSAFSFLVHEFDAPIPSEVLRVLQRARISGAVAEEFARRCAPHARRTPWQDLQSFYAPWRRSLGSASPFLRAPDFARHLQYSFEQESVLSLPYLLSSALIRRFRHGLAA